MNSRQKSFCTFVNVCTNKNFERIIRIVENAIDGIEARQRFLNKLVKATVKGIPIIMILENGFKIEIITYNECLYKYPEIEQFMINNDFITKITSAEFTEITYPHTKEIMDQYLKVPYVSTIQELDITDIQTNNNFEYNDYHSLKKINSSYLHIENSITTSRQTNTYIGYGRGYSPDKRHRPITPLIPIMLPPQNFSQTQGLLTNPPPGMRYSKSTSPTSQLNINAKEFYPIPK